MRKIVHFNLSPALLLFFAPRAPPPALRAAGRAPPPPPAPRVLATGVPFAGTAGAQPQPPRPPGSPSLLVPGDLHVRIVQEAPPPLRQGGVTQRPGPNHLWIKGYWHHTGQAWGWSDGRWSEPPRAHAHWVAARYQKVRGGTRYSPGHWSHEHLIYN